MKKQRFECAAFFYMAYGFFARWVRLGAIGREAAGRHDLQSMRPKAKRGQAW